MKKKIIVTVFLIFAAFGVAAQAAWYDTELADCKNKSFVSEELFENPDSYITRGEVCDLLVSYYTHKYPEIDISIKDNSFNDISLTKYKNSIEKAYSLGLINGMTDTQFEPDSNITREQFVCLIHRMNGNPIAETFIYDDYSDVSEYALSAVDYAVANKIVTGTSKGCFSPKANITRAQAIVIVNRLENNTEVEIGDNSFSGYKQKSETKDYISYITRNFSVMSYRIMLSRGMDTGTRQPDVLVIIDKETGERKLVELEKIVSLHFFDIGDTLYIPICKVSASGIYDYYTQGMYVVDKKSGSVKEINTPVIIDPFAFANDCIYYQTNVETGERSVRPTISKYNIKTGEITLSKQGAIGEFDGNTILYLSENEAVCRRCVGVGDGIENSIYTIDLDTLEMKVISNEPIIAINENYYIMLTADKSVFANLYDRKTNKFIKRVNLEDVLVLMPEKNVTIDPQGNNMNYAFYDVNGEFYVRYKNNQNAVCITNEDMFDMDFMFSFFDMGYQPDNSSYIREDKAFFITGANSGIFSTFSGEETPRTDAAVASLYSRKTYGADKTLGIKIFEKQSVREFCAKYKREYDNPYDMIRALNNYLTYECSYDDATFSGAPTDRKHSAYGAEGIVIEKSGVCNAYAEAVENVLRYYGIKCIMITGGDHGWNMFELDGKKYFIDSTWNSAYGDPDAYYLMSYEEISVEHTADEKFMYLFN